ncbi:hypothetical protein ES708_05158 [subsurface metagenome]
MDYFKRIFNYSKILFLLTGFYILSIPVNAQETQFTLFHYSPLTLNPANTGSFNGDLRIAGNFRNQWAGTSTPFRTAAVSMDTKLFLLHQKFGIGVHFLNDESGVGGLTYNKLYASLSYEKELNDNYFSLGLQAGYVFGSFNSWTVWDNTTGNFSAPSGEENFREKMSYFDLNAGLSWKRSINIFEPEIGVSFFHLNAPNKSFFEGNEKEELKYILNASTKVKFNDEFYLHPAFLYLGKKGATLTIIGTNLGYNFLGNRTSVRQVFGGIYIRNGLVNELESLSILLGTTVSRLDIAISYDLNLSGLSKAAGNNMGAFEISLIYKSISTLLNSYSIPCERY